MASHTEDPMLISYRELRRAIGMIGIALPVLLLGGGLALLEGGIRDSISSYYWSPSMRAVMIGSLCSIGVFLWSYRGDGKWDNAAGNAACIAAVCVALLPCSPPVGEHISNPMIFPWPSANGQVPTRFIHFPAAAVLFLLLAYFCFYSFPSQDPGTTPTKKKPLRNNIYRTCGAIIIVCIAAIGLLHLIFDTPLGSSVFWLESIAVWAFGWSWFIKGKGLSVVQDKIPPVDDNGGSV